MKDREEDEGREDGKEKKGRGGGDETLVVSESVLGTKRRNGGVDLGSKGIRERRR